MATPDRPSFIAHWRQIERPDDQHYDGDDELMSIGAPFGRAFGLTKLGIHHERLPRAGAHPFRMPKAPRKSSSTSSRASPTCGSTAISIDEPGDAVGFPAGTGIAHSFLNNTEAEVHLLVVSDEQSREPHRLSAQSRPQTAA